MENNKENKSLKIAMILLIILLVILLCNFLVKKYSKKEKTNDKAQIENKKDKNQEENKEENKVEQGQENEMPEAMLGHEEFTEEQEDLAIPKVDSVENLEELLKEDKVAILYTSKTCPPCKEQKQIYSKLVFEMNTNVKIYAVEVSNENFSEFLNKENIKVTPTTKIYKNGEEVYKAERKITEEEFLKEYNK